MGAGRATAEPRPRATATTIEKIGERIFGILSNKYNEKGKDKILGSKRAGRPDCKKRIKIEWETQSAISQIFIFREASIDLLLCTIVALFSLYWSHIKRKRPWCLRNAEHKAARQPPKLPEKLVCTKTFDHQRCHAARCGSDEPPHQAIVLACMRRANESKYSQTETSSKRQ